MSSDIPEELIRTLDLRYRRARFNRLKRAADGCGCQKCRRMLQHSGGGLAREISGTPRQQPRSVLLFHGTTLAVARRIQADQRMAPQTTYLAFGWRNRDLARVFAHRASRRRPRDGGPALVAIAVAPDAYERLRRERLIRTIAFDPEDRPELRNRMQLVVEPGGIEILNRGADRFAVVPLTAP
jgi:hypothetical protein